jgi:hypothetical protein
LPRLFPTLGPEGNGRRGSIGFGAEAGSSFASADLSGREPGGMGEAVLVERAAHSFRFTAVRSASVKSIVDSWVSRKFSLSEPTQYTPR